MAVNTAVTIACLLRGLYECFNDCDMCVAYMRTYVENIKPSRTSKRINGI